MNNLEVVRLIEETRRLAPFSEDECRLMQLANALEDAEARVVLAKADALNEAAGVLWSPPGLKALGVYAEATKSLEDGLGNYAVEIDGFYADWLIRRAEAIEVGEI